MKDNTYLNIQSFMIKELDLKGTELLVYAIIYGFSQDEKSEFKGSISYLAEWCNVSRQTIITALKNLVDKGLLEKKTDSIGLKVSYQSKIFTSQKSLLVKNLDRDSQKTLLDQSKNLTANSQKTLPNNINNNIRDNININNKRAYRSYVESYTPNDDLRNALMAWVEMRIVDRKAFTHRALELALQKLDKLADDDRTKIQIVNESIERGWLSFFEPKKKTWEEQVKDALAWAEEEDRKRESERDSSDIIEN